MNTKPRGRELGLPFPGQTGPFNAITDVPGVLVGYCTRDGQTPDGKTIKTGVTAVLPRGYHPQPQPVWAGAAVFCYYGRFLSTVMKASKRCAARASNLPFLMPDQPSATAVGTSCDGSARRRRVGTHSSSIRRIGCEALVGGFEHRYGSLA